MSTCLLSKCLVCFVKVEPQSKSLEETSQFPSETGDFLIDNNIITKSSSPSNPNQSQVLLKRQLDVIFLFRTVLQLPCDQLEKYLDVRGNPEGWIVLCPSCEEDVRRVKEIFVELQKISKKFEEARLKIEEKIKITVSFNEEEGQRGSPRIKDDTDIILKESRRIVSKRKASNTSDAASILEAFLQGDQRAQQLEKNINKRTKLKTEVEPEDGNEEPMDYESLPSPLHQGQDEDEDEADPLDTLPVNNDKDNNCDCDCDSDSAESFRPSQSSNSSSESGDDFEPDEDDDFIASRRVRSATNAKSVKTPTEGRTMRTRRSTLKVKETVSETDEDEDAPCDTQKVTTRGRKKGVRNSAKGRIYLCSLCPKKIATKTLDQTFANLLNHIYRNHQTVYRCKQCPKGFPTLEDQYILDHYYRFHKGVNERMMTIEDRVEKVEEPPKLPDIPWGCPICKKEFKEEDSRDAHVTKRHGNISKSKLERKVKCDHCIKTYFTEEELDAHVLLEHPHHFRQTPFKCDQCQLCLVSERKLRHHRIKIHNLDLFICDQCGAEFKVDVNLTSHIRFKHGDPKDLKEVTCEQCNQVFSSTSVLKSHTRKKHGNMEFPCRVCGKMLKSKSGLKLHMYSYHGILTYGRVPKRYPCTVEGCDKVFYDRVRLKDHLAQHESDEKPFCTICNKEFSSQTALDKHDLKVHKVVKESTKNHTVYDCPKCDIRYTNPKSFKRHLLTCGKSFDVVECGICSARCNTPRDLRNHKIFKHQIPAEELGPEEEEVEDQDETMSEAEVHLCSDCGKSFNGKDRLSFHIKTVHLKTALHGCDLCPRKCYSRGALDHHKAKEHHIGVENFLCLQCNTFCKSTSQMKRHNTLTESTGRRRSTLAKNVTSLL